VIGFAILDLKNVEYFLFKRILYCMLFFRTFLETQFFQFWLFTFIEFWWA